MAEKNLHNKIAENVECKTGSELRVQESDQTEPPAIADKYDEENLSKKIAEQEDLIVEADNILLNVIEARKHYPAKLKRLSSEEFVAQERRILTADVQWQEEDDMQVDPYNFAEILKRYKEALAKRKQQLMKTEALKTMVLKLRQEIAMRNRIIENPPWDLTSLE